MTAPARELFDAAMSEDQFMDLVLRYAKLRRWRAFHPYDSRRSVAGWPDITLVRDGRLVFVELKTAKGRATSAQQQWLDELAQVPGVEAHLFRPSEWDEIREVLR